MQAFIDSKIGMSGGGGANQNANGQSGGQQSAVLAGNNRGTEPNRIRAHTELKDFTTKKPTGIKIGANSKLLH